MARIETFDRGVDVEQALLWQYDQATHLKDLLAAKTAWYAQHQTGFWTDWERDIFDLRTANDFGLTVWAIILNIPLLVTVQPSGDRTVWGFGPDNLDFERGGFGRAIPAALALTTEQRRLALRLRFFQLTTNGTVPQINQFLAALFADQGRVYVLDSLDMTFATYVFEFAPSGQVLTVLREFDLLPRPAGVGSRILVVP